MLAFFLICLGNDRDSLSGSVLDFSHFLGGKSMLVVNGKCCDIFWAHPIRKRGEARGKPVLVGGPGF